MKLEKCHGVQRKSMYRVKSNIIIKWSLLIFYKEKRSFTTQSASIIPQTTQFNSQPLNAERNLIPNNLSMAK